MADEMLQKVADRVAAMQPNHGTEDYRQGQADALRRVVRLLNWLADGEGENPEQAQPQHADGFEALREFARRHGIPLNSTLTDGLRDYCTRNRGLSQFIADRVIHRLRGWEIPDTADGIQQQIDEQIDFVVAEWGLLRTPEEPR